MIKKMNSANAGVKRPVRVSDLQDLWGALPLLHGGYATDRVVILWGFDDKGDGNLSKGLILKNDVLYYHSDESGYRLAVGSEVYGNLRSGVDLRVFSDFTQQDFSFNQIATNVDSAEPLGTFTLNYINIHRIKPKYREVEGVVRIHFTEDVVSVSFTPDDVNDSDISVVDLLVGANTVQFGLADGSSNRMRKGFTPFLKRNGDTLYAISIDAIPTHIMQGSNAYLTDIWCYWGNDIPSAPSSIFSIDYQIKILFDV